jgi:hypothetical protein
VGQVLEGLAPTLAVETSGLTQPQQSLAEMRVAKALYRASESKLWESVFP